jgi:hypothetical protein
MNAPQTAALLARTVLDRAEATHRAAVEALDKGDSDARRQAIREAREERELAVEQLAIAEKKERDARGMAVAKARAEKVARLSAIRAALTRDSFTGTIGIELEEMGMIAARLVELHAALKAKALALGFLQNEGIAIARELGLEESKAPQFGYPEGLQWTRTACADAIATSVAGTPIIAAKLHLVEALGI